MLDPRFETGEFVTADQLLASNAILAERLALMVRPLARYARVDFLSGLSIEEVTLVFDAYDMLQDLAKELDGG